MNWLIVTECAIEHDNRFLIIKRPNGVHASGMLAFPGGKFEIADGQNHTNDAVKHCIKREVQEEVGLNLVDDLRYVTTSYFQDTVSKQHIIDIIYHCQIKHTELSITASKREVPEYYWLTKEEIAKHENSPIWLKNYIQLINNK